MIFFSDAGAGDLSDLFDLSGPPFLLFVLLFWSALGDDGGTAGTIGTAAADAAADFCLAGAFGTVGTVVPGDSVKSTTTVDTVAASAVAEFSVDTSFIGADVPELSSSA